MATLSLSLNDLCHLRERLYGNHLGCITCRNLGKKLTQWLFEFSVISLESNSPTIKLSRCLSCGQFKTQGGTHICPKKEA